MCRESKAAELRQAAKKYGLDLVAIVMGNSPDRNYTEGVLSKDALFVAHDGMATFQPDNPTRVLNADFEDVNGNHFNGWAFQDDEGVTTFADHEVTHGGKTSLRMENIGKNQARHCRIAQPITLQPHRQYRISFWVKTAEPVARRPRSEGADRRLRPTASVSRRSTPSATQDWKHYDLVFNSLDNSKAMLYLGSWYGKDGKMWWDDLNVEEIGLVNVLRRPGCPVTVRGENGTAYRGGAGLRRRSSIPNCIPYRAYHEPPVIHLTAEHAHQGGRAAARQLLPSHHRL